MAWSRPTINLVDEVALQGADELLGIARERVSRSPDAAADLARSVFEVFGELWPAGEHVDTFAYLIIIERDIDKMPPDLLEGLIVALTRRARDLRSEYRAASSAAQLVANWLKMRLVELRAELKFQEMARYLKGEHKALFKNILSTRAAADAELAS